MLFNYFDQKREKQGEMMAIFPDEDPLSFDQETIEVISKRDNMEDWPSYHLLLGVIKYFDGYDEVMNELLHIEF